MGKNDDDNRPCRTCGEPKGDTVGTPERPHPPHAIGHPYCDEPHHEYDPDDEESINALIGTIECDFDAGFQSAGAASVRRLINRIRYLDAELRDTNAELIVARDPTWEGDLNAE